VGEGGDESGGRFFPTLFTFLEHWKPSVAGPLSVVSVEAVIVFFFKRLPIDFCFEVGDFCTFQGC
jgi:hypothetical protein